MSDSYNSKFLDDPEFQSLLVGCLESLQRGETIDRQALAKDFPEYAAEIGKFLKDRQLLEQVASGFGDVEPSRVTISAYEQTIDSRSGKEAFAVGDAIRYIGEYEVLEEIARGGMGIVFKARQQKLNRIVALKMILAGRLADKADVERFHREARAAGRLKHVNIVPVHEIGEHEGRQYFTMDFVEGQSLAEIIRHETLSPQKAARAVKVMAEAVQYAHHEGIVHRDLKPANVLIDQHNEPHITDFGLARMLESVDEESRAELTATGQILGTPSYMSPEQASGKQALVGPPSDIYSLGAILYASLTGRAPFVADSPVDTLLQVMRNEPVSPRDLNPSVPKDLETICLKCLSKEPHKRYGTAQELADDLNRFLEGRPVVARPVGPINKAIRWCRRNRTVATLLCLLFVSMAAGTAISVNYAVEATRLAKSESTQRKQAEENRGLAEDALEDARTQRDIATKAKLAAETALSLEEQARQQAENARRAEIDAREAAERALLEEEKARQEAQQRRTEALWQTYVARLQPMMYRFSQGEYGQLEAMLEDAKPQAESEPDFRGWEWHYLKNLALQQSSRVGTSEQFSKHFDWHPETQRLAVFNDESLDLWVGDLPQFKKRICQMPPGVVRFSPDGTQLAVVSNLTVQVISIATGEVLGTLDLARFKETNRNSAHIDSIDWQPDQTILAVGTDMGAVYLWDTNGVVDIRNISILPRNFPCNDMHWHPTDSILAVASRSGNVFVVDAEQDKLLWVNRIDRDYVHTSRWNPEGTLVVGATSGGSDGSTLVVWDREGEVKLRSEGGAITGIPKIDWLDDEEFIVATSDHDLHHFRIDEPNPIRTVRAHVEGVRSIVSWGDRRRVVTSSQREIRVTQIRDQVELAKAFPAHKYATRAISFSPDSRRVATVSWDRIVAISDVQSGKVIHRLEGHSNGAINDVEWSPDGLKVCSCDHNGEFCVWDADAGELIAKFRGGSGTGSFNSVIWINDHQIAGGHSTLGVFDVHTGEMVRQLDDSLKHFASLAFCPSRQLIGHLAMYQVSVFDPNGRTIYQGPIDARNGLAWSPDGKLLITGGEPGIGVFDCVHFKQLTTIKGHAGEVTDVCFSPDGSRIASSGRDGTVRVWDRATGAELLILKHPGARSFHCIAWSPDGSTIAACAREVIIAWSIPGKSDVRTPDAISTGKIAPILTSTERIDALTEAIEVTPLDQKLIRERAELYASQLMWKEAFADYQKVLEINPGLYWESTCAARAALMLGDRDAYLRLLRRPLEDSLNGKLKSLIVQDYAVRTACLSPTEDLDLNKLLSIAQAHVAYRENAWWANRGMILVHLRLGNNAEALELLDRFQSAELANKRIFAAAVQAIAYHQMEDELAASKALTTAMNMADECWYLPADTVELGYGDIEEFVAASILLDEAKRTILKRRASAYPMNARNAKPSKKNDTAIANQEGHSHPFKGEWKVRQMQRGGVNLEQADTDSATISFSQDEVNLPGFGASTFIYQLAKSQSKGTIDVTVEVNNKPQQFSGLYEIKDKTLTMVINEWPDGPRPKQLLPADEEDLDTPKTHRLFVVLRRVDGSVSCDELKASAEDEVIKQD